MRPRNRQIVAGDARKVTVVVPCRGIQPGLKDNLTAILGQDYPCYEVIFVTPRGDTSARFIAHLVDAIEPRAGTVKIVSADPHDGRSDKINNQLAGLKEMDEESEIVVFFDSDGRPLATFLSNLVAPLHHRDHVVTTSYRWYLPDHFSVTAVSAMLCGALALLLQSHRPFTLPWGGAMAVRTSDFRRLLVAREWEGALYDDYVLGLLLERARRTASFVPSAIVTNPTPATLRERLQAGTRHFLLMRVVLFQKWLLALLSVSLAILSPLLVLALIPRLDLRLTSQATAIIALSLPTLCAVVMWSAVSTCENLSKLAGHPTHPLPRKYLALAFAVPLIFLIQIVSSAFGTTVTWQNITYEVTAYNETSVLRRQGERAPADRLSPELK